MLALVGMLVDLKDITPQSAPKAVSNVCQQVVQDDSRLSRDELSRLLAIPERDTKQAIQQVVSQPYCTLPDIEVRAGVMAQREAYPLEFDLQTWFVVLYEGNEYAGYSFVFQH